MPVGHLDSRSGASVSGNTAWILSELLACLSLTSLNTVKDRDNDAYHVSWIDGEN